MIEAASEQRAPTKGRDDVTEMAKVEAGLHTPFPSWTDDSVHYSIRESIFFLKAKRLGIKLPASGTDLVQLQKSVQDDLEARAEMGLQKYGTRLLTFNGRDAELDMLQELYDAWVYSSQKMMEKD